MKKISTSSILSDSSDSADRTCSTREPVRPRRSTLDFLRQFARCYHFESKIPATLQGLVLN